MRVMFDPFLWWTYVLPTRLYSGHVTTYKWLFLVWEVR